MCLIGVTTLHSRGDSQGEIPAKDVFIMEMVDTQTERENLLYRETSTKHNKTVSSCSNPPTPDVMSPLLLAIHLTSQSKCHRHES